MIEHIMPAKFSNPLGQVARSAEITAKTDTDNSPKNYPPSCYKFLMKNKIIFFYKLPHNSNSIPKILEEHCIV